MPSLDIQIFLPNVNFLELNKLIHQLYQTKRWHQFTFPPATKVLPGEIFGQFRIKVKKNRLLLKSIF